jgi:hypothetical protein
MALHKVSTPKLAAEVILEQEIRTKEGMLLVTKAQEITTALLIKLENRAKAGQLDKEIMALVPV